MHDPSAIKQINQTMWAYGDYPSIAALVQSAADALVDDLSPGPGTEHLDVATGNGNVALSSAVRGARVHGLDLTDAHFPDARRRAESSGVKIDFVQGDAEALPWPDRSFDLVTSTFGVQFAPRHEVAAGELVRVARPGAVIGMCNWTPRSWTAHFQEVLSSYFPSPPNYTAPPMLWGRHDYLSNLLGNRCQLRSELRAVHYPFSTAEGLIAFFENSFGPFINARQSLGSEMRWRSLREELVELTEGFLEDTPLGRQVRVEYLHAVAEVGLDPVVVRPSSGSDTIRDYHTVNSGGHR